MDISCKSRNCNSCVLRDYMGENSIGMQLYGCKKIGNCNDTDYSPQQAVEVLTDDILQ